MIGELIQQYDRETSPLKKLTLALELIQNQHFDRDRNLVGLKFAYLTSYTSDYLKPLLFCEALRHGILLEIYHANYEQYAVDILNQESGLHRFKPDVVFVSIWSRDLFPELYYGWGSRDLERDCLARLETIIPVLKEALSYFPFVLLSKFSVPYDPSFISYPDDMSPSKIIDSLNRLLHDRLREFRNLGFLDFDSLFRKLGSDHISEEKFWYYGRFTFTPAGLIALSQRLMPYFFAVKGLTKKCLVVDLDDTVWGGVVGEEGLDGIKLSESGEGQVFRDFQKALLNLYHRGILLAICSKNDYETAMEVIHKHPSMILREEYFASVRINWNPKYQNLKEIAEELNIGLDSLVFWDDSPVERAGVRSLLPEVTVPEVPAAKEKYIPFLLSMPYFSTLGITEEDTFRGEMYQHLKSVRELRSKSGDLESFLKSLHMKVRVSSVSEENLSRLAQMTQKTNQFNLSSKRYAPGDIRGLAQNINFRFFVFSLEDVFGDSGICGLAIVERLEREFVLDTFLMSCRVIGRRLESFMVSYILSSLKKEGCALLIGTYYWSKKNSVIKDFMDTYFDVVKRKNGDEEVTYNISGDKLKVDGIFELEKVVV